MFSWVTRSISKSLFEGNVIIKENTKIDSQVRGGHNCIIGKIRNYRKMY